MRILFLHKYDRQAAAYRYRFEQYFPYLKSLGYSVQSQTLLESAYLTDKFQNKPTNFFRLVNSYLKRIRFLLTLKNADCVVIYMEVFPYLPFFVEYFLILRRIPYIVDMDDAIYLSYKRHRNLLVRSILGSKFDKIFTHAACIFAGNADLKAYAATFNANVQIVPTVVDMAYYNQQKNFVDTGAPVTIGWIGSPSTATNLLSLSDALTQVAEKYRVEFFFVGCGTRLSKFLPNITFKEWSLKDELSDILKIDIGIMPLNDDVWNRGKCGFKLIQYMACGLPVVGSPVGVNQKIIEHGVNGFLATTTDDWVKALSSLIESRELRIQFGRNGVKKIAKEYSVNYSTPIIVESFKAISG